MSDDLSPRFRHAATQAEEENTLLLGQDSHSLSGFQERSPAETKLNTKRAEQESKYKKVADFINMLDALQASIDRLTKDIERMEDQFNQQDGDAWREKLALRVLDEDDIPQRRESESMEAYRERLEIHLIDEMLNEDGTIKDKYKNNPELAAYAEWAQKQYHLNKARGYVQELEALDTSAERKEEILNELRDSDFEQLALVDKHLQSDNDIRQTMDDVRQLKHNDVQTANAVSSFLKPIS